MNANSSSVSHLLLAFISGKRNNICSDCVHSKQKLALFFGFYSKM